MLLGADQVSMQERAAALEPTSPSISIHDNQKLVLMPELDDSL